MVEVVLVLVVLVVVVLVVDVLVVVVVVVVVGLIILSEENAVATSIGTDTADRYPPVISDSRKEEVLEMIDSPIWSFLEEDCRPRKLKSNSILTCTKSIENSVRNSADLVRLRSSCLYRVR